MNPILVKVLTSPAFWEFAHKAAVRVIEYLSEKDENDLTPADVERVKKAITAEQAVRKARRKVGPRK